MKSLLFSLATLGILSSISAGLEAINTTESSAATAAVPAKLQQLSYISDARPSADASFYVYLCSASWCPPCRAIMPKVVAQYPAIKAAGGEIILLCFDSTPQAGAAYIKKYNATFPAVMSGFRSEEKLELPGFTPPRGIPNVTFVTPDGKVLHQGHGATLLNWNTIITK